MKKSLFFIMAMLLTVALLGQVGNPMSIKVKRNHERKAIKEMEIVPSVRPSQLFPPSKQGSWAVGQTSFSAISNSSARNTASAHPSGDMASVWTFLYGSTRGTGYNWYDKVDNGWDPFPTVRIEDAALTGSPGFPTYAFTEEGEINVAHNAATNSLVVLTREQRGKGDWIQSSISEEGYPEGLWWPTMSTSGNTVHLVAVYDVYDNFSGALYFRSKDGGITWDIRAYDFPELPKTESERFFADNYTIASKGNHVVLAWRNHENANIGYVESLDGGDSWTYKPVYECNADLPALLPPTFIAETVAAAIDDEDNVHIAFSGYVGDEYGDYIYCSAIIYWKSNMPTLTPEYFDIEYETVAGEFEITKLGYENFPNCLTYPELLGFKHFWFWNEPDATMLVDYNYFTGMYDPRIVAEGGKVYLTYGSILEEPMIFTGDPQAFYRGVFLTVSDDNGDTFDQLNRTSWISYDNRYFLCDWSEYMGPVVDPDPEDGVTPQYEGEVFLEKACENGWPTMALNSGDGNLLLQWGNTRDPGEPSGNDYYIYCVVLKKSLAGVYNNTREIWTGKWNDYNLGINDVKGGVESMAIFPNPAKNSANVLINSICNKPYTLTVANTMGQIIHTQNGQLGFGENSIELNINSLASGIYLINIKTDNTSRTQKLIVK